MIRFYKTPQIFKWWHPKLVWKTVAPNSIHLTFDDGPDKEVTPWVLDQLQKADAKATFFCLGKNLVKESDLVEKMKSDGHLLANHTHDHLNGLKVDANEYIRNIIKCDQALKSFGISNTYFRPPYGKIARKQIQLLNHKKIIMWSHMAYDFDQDLINVDSSINSLKRASAGSILTLHDSKKAFKNLKLILPEILSHFQTKGYSMKSLEHD